MLSIADLARRDGVSKPTVSVAVKRLVERHGLSVERDGQGRVALVNAVEYDHLRQRFGDPSKAQAPAAPASAPPPSAPAVPASETYDEALRQKTWHEAEKRRLELEELKGNLLRRERLEDALARCGEQLIRVIERLPQSADDLADAVAKEGAHGLRLALKKLTVRMRADAAAALTHLASGAPAEDETDEAEPA